MTKICERSNGLTTTKQNDTINSHQIRPRRRAWTSERWTIAIACSVINLFLFSVFRSAGVVYVELKNKLGCSNEEAAWPITLSSGVASITCLVSGFLSHYFEKRTIVFTGTVVTSFGIAICYFANGIKFVIVFLGVVQGIGIGLVTVLLPVIIAEHFGEQRAAAVGLSYAGATLGAFVFPIFFNWLLEHFTLWQALLLMGAIIANALPAVLLLRQRSTTSGNDSENIGQPKRCSHGYEPVLDEPIVDMMDEHGYEHSIASKPTSATCAVYHERDNHNRARKDDSANETAVVANEQQRQDEMEANYSAPERCNNDGRDSKKNGSTSLLAVKIDANDEKVRTTVKTERVNSSSDEILYDIGSSKCSLENDENVSFDRKKKLDRTIGNGNELQSSLLNEANNDTAACMITTNHRNAVHAPSSSSNGTWLAAVLRHARKDFTLLKSPYFTLITFTYICFIVCNVTLLIILVDYGKDCGLREKQAVLLLSMYSVTDLCGRLLPGWLSYAKITSNKMYIHKTLYVASITGLGCLFYAFPLLLSEKREPDAAFEILLALTLACGFVAGCQMILPPVIIGDYLGTANVPVAFGFANFICGIVSFGRPFLIGYVKDRTGKYDDVFYLLGSFALTSSLLWFVEMIVSHARQLSKLHVDDNDCTYTRPSLQA